jgi:hypothetical protein
VVNCEQSVALGPCNGSLRLEARGDPPEELRLRVTQRLDQVTAYIYTRGGQGPLEGSVDANGTLSPAGTLFLKGSCCRLFSWATVVTADAMSGYFDLDFFGGGDVITGRARWQLRSLKRVRAD